VILFRRQACKFWNWEYYPKSKEARSRLKEIRLLAHRGSTAQLDHNVMPLGATVMNTSINVQPTSFKFFSILLLGLLAACSQPISGSSDEAANKTQTNGQILSVDGADTGLEGIVVSADAFATTAETDALGEFDLGALPQTMQEIVVTIPDEDGPGDRTLSEMVDLTGMDSVDITLTVDGNEMVQVAINSCQDFDTRNRFKLDVDGDGLTEDGYIRVRGEHRNRQQLKVEIGSLEVDQVVIQIEGLEDDYSVTVRENGEAELELDLPNVLDLVGNVVTLVINDEQLDLGLIPSPGTSGEPNCDGDDDSQNDHGGEFDVRNRFAVDVDSDAELEDGYVRIRARDDGRQRFKVEVEPVLQSVTIIVSPDDNVSEDDFRGQAELDGMEAELDRRSSLPFGVDRVADLSGYFVFAEVDGIVTFLTTVPVVD
jgi:hypothetical protein